MFDKVNRKYENLHSFSNFSVFSELHLNCQFSCDSIVTKMFEKIVSGWRLFFAFIHFWQLNWASHYSKDNWFTIRFTLKKLKERKLSPHPCLIPRVIIRPQSFHCVRTVDHPHIILLNWGHESCSTFMGKKHINTSEWGVCSVPIRSHKLVIAAWSCLLLPHLAASDSGGAYELWADIIIHRKN